MKAFILIMVFIGFFMFLFLLLSLIGILWSSYSDIISDKEWFGIYSVFIGWWTSAWITETVSKEMKAAKETN